MSTPSENKRRTASLDVRRANIYKRIEAVFDQLGDEFKPADLYSLTGIKNVFATRIIVASVLTQSFGCTVVEDFTPRRRWKKNKEKNT